MFKGFIRFLGSRQLTIGLLIAGAAYFFYLAILWFLNMRPPAHFMVWSPLLVIIIPFLANVLISLFTRHYAYTGNILFHAAFFIVVIGIIISLFYRFEGTAVLTEGSVFWGERASYLAVNKKAGFDSLAPKVSFKLDKIIPEYWGERLHFTRLDGEVRYPAETLENKGIVRLNGGLKINGARIRHEGFGFAPEILVEDLKGGAFRRQTAVMRLFPPGSEDYLELGSYKIYMQIFSDPVEGKEGFRNRSMNLSEPIFKIKVIWMGQQIYDGILKLGDTIRLGTMGISFPKVKYWLQIEIVNDPGELIVIIGFITLIAGLFFRLFFPNPRREKKS